MSIQETAQTQDLHKDPALLYRFKCDLDRVIVGEERNKLTLFLIAASSLTENPVSGVITGESGSGKSWLMKRVLDYFDNKLVYSRMTEASPDRLARNLSGKILAIEELTGVEKAQSSLRVLMSEGRLKLVSIDKDEKGRNRLQEIATSGCPVFLTTTTSSFMDDETLNRIMILSMDESKELTSKILQFEALKYMQDSEITFPDPKLKEFISTFKPKAFNIRVLFANKLCSLFPADYLKARRDFEKLMHIIQVVAFLHQDQRTIIQEKLKTIILAQPIDFLMAWRVLSESIPLTLLNLQERASRTLSIFASNSEREFSPSEVGMMLGLGTHRARQILKSLEGFGFLQRSKRDNHILYSLLKNVSFSTDIGSAYMDISLLSQSDFISVLEASRTQFKIVQQEWQDLYVDPITGEAFDMNDRKEVERLKTLFSPMQIKSKDMTLVELDSNSIKPVEPTMNELISSILSALGNNSLYHNDIRNEVMNKLNVSPEEVDKALDKLAQQGKIFEESRGVWKKI